jgi:hypothetical protein
VENSICPTDPDYLECLDFLVANWFTQSCNNPFSVYAHLFYLLHHIASSDFVSYYEDFLEVHAVLGEAPFEIPDFAFELGGLHEAH